MSIEKPKKPSLLEKIRSGRSGAEARNVGSAALGASSRVRKKGESEYEVKYKPDLNELTKAGIRVSSEQGAVMMSRIGDSFASTKARALRDIVIIGDTLVGVIDQFDPEGKFKGVEVSVLPYSTADGNVSSVFLRQTITPGGQEAVVLSRDYLQQKGVTDPTVSNGQNSAGHAVITIMGSNVFYNDSNSTNGTTVLRGKDFERAAESSQELTKLVGDLRGNPGYLYGTTDGKAVVVPQP